MTYKINDSGERIILSVLTNADKSMVGLHVGKSRIITIDFYEFCNLAIILQNDIKCDTVLLKYHASKIKDEVFEPLIVMESIGMNLFDINKDLAFLKLYKSADLFSCYRLNYKVIDGKLRFGGIGNFLTIEHPNYWPNKNYTMTNVEFLNFEKWKNEHKDILSRNNNDMFKKIINIYFESFMLFNASMSFIMLFVILEIIFGEKQGELTYRISRGTGFFLSTSKDEMKKLYLQVKKLYNYRSKFVHDGKEIDSDRLFELREIVRKIIVLMYERGMNKVNFDFESYKNELVYAGYDI